MPIQEKAQEQRLYEKKLCEFVKGEYQRRMEERSTFELQWQLNMNFLLGNQYCDIAPESNEIYEFEKEYAWQEREVYNHIAPIVEARLARLSRIKPQMVVRPASGDEGDIQSAKVSTDILRSTYNRLNMSAKISEATLWSEICGSVFYKSVWSNTAGLAVATGNDGKKTYQGDIEVQVCPPFEILPDSPYRNNIHECFSLIHARAYEISQIESIWGVKVKESPANVYSIGGSNISVGGLGYKAFSPALKGEVKKGCAMVFEYYEKPSPEHKNGRLIITTEDALLYEGQLPYINGTNQTREFPFVQQVCILRPGCIWGISVIERCIPIQRAYNAVKNRKHEFINRAAFGVLAVEDGTVDTENLEQDGLAPGKILIYRQGANPPQMLNPGAMPAEFIHEEESLLREFEMISGVSEMMRRSYAEANASSGVALSLITEQDDTRLAVTAEHIRDAVLQMSVQWLRLYKQLATGVRLEKIVGENGSVSQLYWKASQITSDDVVHETENELSQSIAQRRQMVFDLLARGLFYNDQGGMDEQTKTRLLRIVGLGDWENAKDISQLQSAKAQRENLRMKEGQRVEISEADDHEWHIMEHSKHMLREEYEHMSAKSPHLAQLFVEHLRLHKAMLANEKETALTAL